MKKMEMKKILIILSLVLVIGIISGCTIKQVTKQTTNLNTTSKSKTTEDVNDITGLTIDTNVTGVENELNDPSLNELDNINLSNW